jgi:hypothetical protein
VSICSPNIFVLAHTITHNATIHAVTNHIGSNTAHIVVHSNPNAAINAGAIKPSVVIIATNEANAQTAIAITLERIGF